MKLLSIAIPCYNSENYMRHCIESLLPGGDEVEIRCSGPDEEEALSRAVELIESGLGEAGGGRV